MKEALVLLSIPLVLCIPIALRTNRDDDFLPNWMGRLQPVIGGMTISDISLPGTHDTLTYDLSKIISNGAIGDEEPLSLILHTFATLAPGEYIRQQAQTQGLTIKQQLDAGIRFIDFRVMWSSNNVDPWNWYSLHFVQTNQPAINYVREIREWLDAHPEEVIVIWFSRHGNTDAVGNDQYPDVHDSDKVNFFNEVANVFSGLLFDTRTSAINTTTIDQLVKASQRVVIFASDYDKFTGSSRYALDARSINNQCVASVDDEANSFVAQNAIFANASAIRAQNKAEGKLFLMSLASSSPEKQIILTLEMAIFPEWTNNRTLECAKVFPLPNVTNYCPMRLLDISQLTNYYSQRVLEHSLASGYDLPMAFYLDAVDIDGTFRTGTGYINPLLDGEEDTIAQDPHSDTRYAYVDTVLYATVQKLCKGVQSEACASALSFLSQRRQRYPLQLWQDELHGRLENWPVI